MSRRSAIAQITGSVHRPPQPLPSIRSGALCASRGVISIPTRLVGRDSCHRWRDIKPNEVVREVDAYLAGFVEVQSVSGNDVEEVVHGRGSHVVALQIVGGDEVLLATSCGNE